MQDKLYRLMDWAFIEGIVYSEEDDPHRILGPHRMGAYLVFQTFQPGAVSVNVLLREEKKILPMERMDEEGYFAAMILYKKITSYQYEVTYEDDKKEIIEDAYRFLPQINAQDTDKFAAGIHDTLYEKLGAHLTEIDGVKGCAFAVWAPNALRVSVVGDFNGWDGRVHQMRRLWDSGIFEIFVPAVKEGQCYKFEIKTKGGLTYLKADPFAFGAELRPDTASVVRDIRDFTWHDKKWLSGREKKQSQDAPLNIYELYLGSFSALDTKEREEEAGCRDNYREIADRLTVYMQEMGYTHVELMPVMEHPLDESWGYQTTSYYAPTSRYGKPQDFQYLIDRLHQEGFGVILDWVPAWFPKDGFGLSAFDGTYLYEHIDPRQGDFPPMGTALYNYGRPEVRNFLIANALFWVEKYHADGIRMNGVDCMLYLDYGKGDGQWVPNMYGGNENLEAIEFIRHLNSVMKKRNPGVLMIADEPAAWPLVTGALKEDGLGFDYKWNVGWKNDYLDYIQNDPYFRAAHHDELTLSMVYAYSENFILALSHEDVVHGKGSLYQKMPGKAEDKLASLKLTYAYQMTHPGKKLLFMGQEFGDKLEWQEKRKLFWELLEEEGHAAVHELIKDLNSFYLEHPALYKEDNKESGFQWVDSIDSENCKLTFMRRCSKPAALAEELFVICNFAGVDREVQVGVPCAGKYKEIFNTDDSAYGGEGYINPRAKRAVEKKADGCEWSVKVKMPALSVSIWQVTKE